MKKAMAIVCGAVLALAYAASPATAQTKFAFKLTGGLAYAGGGDLNTGLQGWSDTWITAWGSTSHIGGYMPFHLGMDFGGEFLIQFNPSFALGLGAGYISLSKSSSLTFEGSSTYTWNPKVSAIPITATFYYFLPSTSTMKFFLDAGVGYYVGAKYTDTQHIIFFSAYDDMLDMSGSGFGFHGGLGLQIDFSPQIALLLEARGRYASLKGFTGTETSTGGSPFTGTLYYEEAQIFGTAYLPVTTVDTSVPSGTGVRNGREATIDFSGFSALIGFVFHF